MDLEKVMELSPLHLSLPMMFLSLCLVTGDWVLATAVNSMLVSIYSMTINLLYGRNGASQGLIKKSTWMVAVLAVFMSGWLVQNANLINLILINLLINDYNVYQEISGKEFKFSRSKWLKYQVPLIWSAYVLYDWYLWRSYKNLLGYLLLLLPLYLFVYEIEDFQAQLNSRPDFEQSVPTLLISCIVIYFAADHDTNFNMLVVTIGSMLIITVSQFNKFQKYTSFFNKHLFLANFKLNILIINVVYLLIRYISIQEISYPDILFNLLVLSILTPSENDCFDFEDKIEVKESLFLQIFTSSSTKSISKFLLLNSSFMFVQLLYSFRSKSLSLLSDSLHMMLDCTSLFLGLLANLVSQRESVKFPFGLNRVENLAGFTNACLLVSIVGSIFIESTTRLFKPVQLEKTGELLIVSALGLVVNLVGIFLFNGHGHHGHSHSHSSADILTKESDSNDHQHSHQHSHDHSHSHVQETKTHHDHNHEEMDDNMHGIFLHILADTLGSVGVIISTLLIKFFDIQILDPITSLLIGLLIFTSSIPLIRSSIKNLLLSLPASKTKFLKNEFFQELIAINGVKTYSTPRFWPNKDGKLTGYIHVIFFKNCLNTIQLRESVGELLEKYENQLGDIFIQYENEIDDCWCQKNGN